MVKRFEVWNIDLNPTIGHEINKVRPCVVVSPDEANNNLKTVIVVPLTSTIRSFPTRVNCQFKGKSGQLAGDQIRVVDKERLIKKLGKLDNETSISLCLKLEAIFKY